MIGFKRLRPHTLSPIGERAKHQMIWAQGRVFIFGGSWRGHALGDSCEWNPADGKCRDLTPSLSSGPAPRYSHQMGAIGDRIFLIGGTDGRSVMNDLWEFDTSSEQFVNLTASVPAQLTPRYSHQMVAVRDKAYIFGGRVGDASFRDLFAFDCRGGSFEDLSGRVPSCLSARCAHGMAAIDGILFIFGGWAGSRPNDFWRFHPERTAFEDLSRTRRRARQGRAV